MKAITITKENTNTIAMRFSIANEDIEELLPIGHILVTPFGIDEHYAVLTQSVFDEYFTKTGAVLKNDFYEIMARV